MDPIARRSFWDLIYELSEAGNTIFVSTHYMDEAEYCHRLALMYRGRIIALGTPAGLKETLKSQTLMQLETADLLGSIRSLEGKDSILDVAVFGGGLHVTVREAASGERLIRSALSQSGIEVQKLEVIQPTMEDVFVAMIEAEERKLS